MTRYFVLWHNKEGLPVWDGPYETFEETANSTAMRDRDSDAFVTMTENWRP
jgi:hypothetical protein